MSTPARPTKNDRREEAKAAAEALRAKQAAAAARQRTIAIAALVIGLVVVGGLVAFIVSQGNGSPSANGAQQTPTAVSSRGGMVFDSTGLLEPPADDADWPKNLAADGGPVVVSVYFDFMCPWCGVFEQTQAETLETLLASGDIVIDSHPVTILDRYSNGTGFSTRSASAAVAVGQGSPEHYFDFLTAMMAEGTQPAENTDGLSNAEMAEIAAGVGVPEAVLAEIEAASYADYVTGATDLASQDLGQLSTPTVLINGQNLTQDLGVNWTEEGALEAAILAAKG